MPGAILIDKTLFVTGERSFSKAFWPLPQLATLIKWSSLGLINLNPWRLTTPRKTNSVPLRYEYTYGGQCRINAGEKSAKRIRKKHRLTPEQLVHQPDVGALTAAQPAAHMACETNVVGRGFAPAWYLDAKRCTRLPAPRIEHLTSSITAKLFNQVRRGKFNKTKKWPLALQPAGLGVRAKVHPERQALLGTVDEQFIQSTAWLPQDFDFAMWNAAPLDQQVDYLNGDKIIALTNLCRNDLAAAEVDAQGNTILTLELLKHECFVLLRMESGELIQHPLSIDTLMIKPDSLTLSLVWRSVLNKDKSAPIRECEARMHTHQDRDELQRDIAHIENLLQQAKRAATTNTQQASFMQSDSENSGVMS